MEVKEKPKNNHFDLRFKERYKYKLKKERQIADEGWNT